MKVMGRNIQSAVLSLCLLAAASSLCAGQTVTSSAQIPGLRPYKVDLEYMPRAEKDSVRMVAELWKGYVESFTSSSAGENFRRSFWVDGSQDYLQEFDDGNLLYSSFRENRILDIRKLGDGAYELVSATFSRLPGDDYSDWVEAVFRVCARAVASGDGGRSNPFRLCNWLDVEIPSLTRTGFGNIEYFCAPGIGVPKCAASEMSAFIGTFINEYAPGFSGTVRYVVAPSVDRCERLSGILFNAYSNPLMSSVSGKTSDKAFYGRIFGSGTVLSNYWDDKRDVALLLLRSAWPDALQMIREGVAAYHCGYMDLSYSDLKVSLRSYLVGKKGLDLSDDDTFYDLSIPVAGGDGVTAAVLPIESLIGAAVVEYALSEGGYSLVRSLLECGSYAGLFKALGISSAGADDFIRGLL